MADVQCPALYVARMALSLMCSYFNGMTLPCRAHYEPLVGRCFFSRVQTEACSGVVSWSRYRIIYKQVVTPLTQSVNQSIVSAKYAVSRASYLGDAELGDNSECGDGRDELQTKCKFKSTIYGDI